MFVDYPYVFGKCFEASFIKAANQCSIGSKIDVCLFSRHNNRRNFGTIYDFYATYCMLDAFFLLISIH